MSLSVLSSPWTSGRRSSEVFDIPPDDADAITKLISFPRRDFIEANISFPRLHHDKVRSSLSEPFKTEPTADLGALTTLPLELLGQILLHHTDIHSLITFRNINRRARHVTASLHEYKAITTHGLDFIRALLHTRLATHNEVTLATVHTLQCEGSCSDCAHFAPFVSLPYWKRCCFSCLQFSNKLPVRAPDWRQLPHLLPAQIATLHVIHTLPGRYSTWSKYWEGGVNLVAHYHLKELVLDRISKSPHISSSAYENKILDSVPPTRSEWQHMAACALPVLDIKTGVAEAGVACAGCQLALSKALQSGNVEHDGHEIAERMYTKEGFLHFRWCRYGQVLWKSSGGGEFVPPEMPLVVKMAKLYDF